MASWIVHLRIAGMIAEENEDICETEFIFGNLAPDAGVPLPDGKGYDPPKSASHFPVYDEKLRIRPAGWKVYLDKYLDQKNLENYNKQALSFHLGYLSHLITDSLWSQKIVYPLVEQDRAIYDLGGRERHELAAKWKRDWYGSDMLYLENHPDFMAFSVYSHTENFKNFYLDWFSEDAFIRQRERILDFYSDRSMKNADFRYLTPQQADDFVDLAAEAVRGRIAEIRGTMGKFWG